MRIALLATILSVPVVASAHVDMLDPPRRYGLRDLKDGPCGIPFGAAGDVVATYEGGSTIDIEITEYVEHPGHYRVALDVDGGDDNLGDPICLTNCDDRRSADPTFEEPADVLVLGNFEDDPAEAQTLTVTLPDIACERCTLQVIQVMYDKRPYTIGGDDNYYRCADIAITSAGPGDAGPGDAGSGGSDAGTPLDAGSADDAGPGLDAGSDAGLVGDSGSPGADAGLAPDDDGGCAVGSSRSGSVFFYLLAGLALWRRRLRCAS
ncbi:MAG: SCE4755 family polysaccharide monooxygenase-like protein [Polyangiales bacterium]